MNAESTRGKLAELLAYFVGLMLILSLACYAGWC